MTHQVNGPFSKPLIALIRFEPTKTGREMLAAIAKALYISQSTVRNHLSSAFRKLRVASQQELISLVRNVRNPPDR